MDTSTPDAPGPAPKSLHTHGSLRFVWALATLGLLMAGCTQNAGTQDPVDRPDVGQQDAASNDEDAVADDTAQEVVEDEPGCLIDADCPDGQICDPELADCRAGCRAPADCPRWTTCRATVCEPVPCAIDADCGNGARCNNTQCEDVGEAPCEGDEDCGYRWLCGEGGLCVEPGCFENADCPADQWCRDGVCQTRRQDFGPLGFERRFPSPLAEHRGGVTDGICGDCAFCARVEAFGGALFDMDGDGDQDVFLGTGELEGQSPPCVYQNVSEPGNLSFEPDARLCTDQYGALTSGGGVDVDGDGVDELVLMGTHKTLLVRFEPQFEVVDLLDLLPPDDSGRQCVAGAMVAADLNFDGRVDLMIGCQLLGLVGCGAPARDIDAQRNLVFLQTPDGQMAPSEAYPALRNEGITLALGVIDINDDGLPDVLVGNDDFSLAGSGGGMHPPGDALVRCAPDQPCNHTRWAFGEGLWEGGSLMGFGNIHIDTLGDHLYASDWGTNRMVRFEPEGTPVDISLDLGTDVTRQGSDFLFGWGVVVEDFDRNGLDDIYLAQGSSWPGIEPRFDPHHDVVLLQRAGPEFVVREHDEVGLSPNDLEDALGGESHWGTINYASRGAVRADLDGDGNLELLTGALWGRIKLHTEVPADPSERPRCTLIPRGAYVPAYGHSHAVSGEGAVDWRRRDLQGQMRFGASATILTQHNRGLVRFPSGAQVPFDCQNTAGPIEVVEPQWIELERDGQGLLITLQTPWLTQTPALEVAVRGQTQEAAILTPEVVSEGQWRLEGPMPEGAQWMLKLDGRWVPRWFDAP